MPPKPFKPPRPVGVPSQAGGSFSSNASAAISRPTAPKDAPKAPVAAALADEDAEIFDIDSSALMDLDVVPTTTAGPSKPVATSAMALPESSEEEDEDALEAQQRAQQPQSSAHGKIHIPPKLISRLLHDKFKKEETRITSEAMAAVQIYIETFAKEAVARAEEERKESGGAESGGFLEVCAFFLPTSFAQWPLWLMVYRRLSILKSCTLSCCLTFSPRRVESGSRAAHVPHSALPHYPAARLCSSQRMCDRIPFPKRRKPVMSLLGQRTAVRVSCR